MDAREADLEPGQKWTGWHLIEKDLWPQRAEDYAPLTPKQRKAYADDLLANTETLDKRIGTLEFTVDQIANGSRGLLEEVATGKVTGEEEYWSRTDLWDFQANVDGARVGYEGVRPILENKDPDLAEALDARFAELQTLLDAQRRRRRLHAVRRPDRRGGQGPGRRRQRPVRAVVPPDRRRARLTGRPMKVSRRGLIGGGAAAAGMAGAFIAGRAADSATTDVADGDSTAPPYPFRGEHQAGIVTPAQDRLHFAAFDVTTDSRDELVALLQAWTAAAERMTQGDPAGPVGPTEGAANLPPDDTGEAIGLPAAGLTITFGFGPGLFVDADGQDRFGLADRRPAALRDLPHFPGDLVEDARSRGDICIQACAAGPAGGRARDPQPGPDRLRHGRGALVAAGLRAYVDHLDLPVDAAQPVRLQGRHRQRQGRGDRGARGVRLGAGRRLRGRATGSPVAPISWPAGST